MIDFAKYLGIDNSKLALPFEMVDDIVMDDFANGGPIIAFVVSREPDPVKKLANRERVRRQVSHMVRNEIEIAWPENSVIDRLEAKGNINFETYVKIKTST